MRLFVQTIQLRLMSDLVRSYKMENIKIIVSETTGEEHVIIDHGNDQFTSMPKAIYDEQLANEAASK